MYYVDILRVSDGAVHRYIHPHPWGDASEYQWTDGNFGCDCNRHMFFHNYDDGAGDHDCGTSAYRVRITDPSKKELFRDDDWKR